jgi:uncharacterized protein YrzB (UPF0473 family)
MTQEHDNGCDCGECEEIITLIDDNGEEKDFTVIDIIELDGSEYAILLPVESEESEDEEDSEEAIILKFTQDEDGEDVLVDIEDDDEWEKVADTWEDMLAKEES